MPPPQFHGRAYSMWSQVTFLTTHATRGFRYGPVEYVPVRPPEPLLQVPNMGGGVERVPSGGGEVRVCTCERAMVDLFHSPALGGGWEEIFRSLSMVEFFDLEAAIAYTLVLDSAVTTARVGFLLSLHRKRLFVGEARYLDTSRVPGRLVHPWNLIVPEWVLDERWEEVA